jgi:uncharacterized SAM-binding protein YcdF (DUF218 family)
MKKFTGDSKKTRNYRKWIFIGLIVLSTYITVILVSIPVKIAITRFQYPEPEAILVLGSDLARTEVAASIWKKNKELRMWISDLPEDFQAQKIVLEKNEVQESKVILDGRPTDTVTNFTTLVDDFNRENIHHLYLVTSDYHMRRSVSIAFVVLGSRGIIVTEIPAPSNSSLAWFREETNERVFRDVSRSILWVFTGRTGASLNPRINR